MSTARKPPNLDLARRMANAIRMLAVEFPQSVDWDGWAARHILTVNELEALTGLDFNPELPDFIQRPIEAERPTRLWPVRFRDIFSQILFRFN